MAARRAEGSATAQPGHGSRKLKNRRRPLDWLKLRGARLIAGGYGSRVAAGAALPREANLAAYGCSAAGFSASCTLRHPADLSRRRRCGPGTSNALCGPPEPYRHGGQVVGVAPRVEGPLGGSAPNLPPRAALWGVSGRRGGRRGRRAGCWRNAYGGNPPPTPSSRALPWPCRPCRGPARIPTGATLTCLGDASRGLARPRKGLQKGLWLAPRGWPPSRTARG